MVKIFWGDDDIESNSTEIDSTDKLSGIMFLRSMPVTR